MMIMDLLIPITMIGDAVFSAAEKYFKDKGFVTEEEAILEYTWTDAAIEMWANRKSGDVSGF